MESNISEEELDRFLKETGIIVEEQEKEDPLEKLVEEIMGSVNTVPPPLPASEAPDPSLLESHYEQLLAGPTKPKRFKFPLLPLFISIAFLGGILLGTPFGFYWGKTQKIDPFPFEEIEAKISLLAKQVQEIYDKVTPTSPPDEIIEPIEPLPESESLAPDALL